MTKKKADPRIPRARWTRKTMDAGRCVVCNKKRGKEGTTRYCRPCANKHNARMKDYYYLLRYRGGVGIKRRPKEAESVAS